MSNLARIYSAFLHRDSRIVDRLLPTLLPHYLKRAPYINPDIWERRRSFSFFLSLPRVSRPIGFFSLTTTSLFSVLACAVQTNARIILFRRLRSTALFASFLATATPKSGLWPSETGATYKPQYKVVLGRVFSNSEILALFNG